MYNLDFLNVTCPISEGEETNFIERLLLHCTKHCNSCGAPCAPGRELQCAPSHRSGAQEDIDEEVPVPTHRANAGWSEDGNPAVSGPAICGAVLYSGKTCASASRQAWVQMSNICYLNWIVGKPLTLSEPQCLHDPNFRAAMMIGNNVRMVPSTDIESPWNYNYT